MCLFHNTVQVAPPPRNLLQAPPISQPTVPQLQMTPPPKEMLQTPPASQPILPKLPDNKPPLSLPVAPGTICTVIFICFCTFY